jgi:hypothetical protein
MVNLPCGTATISGQPFEQSRNGLPEAGSSTRLACGILLSAFAVPMTAGRTETDAAASPQSAIAWTAALPDLGPLDKLKPNLLGIA